MKLEPGEKIVRGQWKLVEGKMEADECCRRIEDLTQRYLHEVSRDESGWDTLYVDPSDGRYWELTYPDSASHGGGSPILACLSRDEARRKYGDLI